MFIISGSAQYTLDEGKYNKDDLHTFTLFSENEILEDNLSSIEVFLNDLGWDEIHIEESHIIEDSSQLDHRVLKDGFEKATKQEFAVVINNIAVTTVELA